MPKPVPSPKRRSGAVFAAALVAVSVSAFVMSATARAEVTDEQQEACTPDAIKFCSNTIPDIPKTTACMKSHFPQLTPRCRAAFTDATGGAPKPKRTARTEASPAAPSDLPPRAERAPRSERAARGAVEPRPRIAARGGEGRDRDMDEYTMPTRQPPYPPLPTQPAYEAPSVGLPIPAFPKVGGGLPGVASYRKQIARLCRQGLIDPFTCRNTIQALSLSE